MMDLLEYYKVYGEHRRNMKMSFRELKAVQDDKIRRIVRHAYDSVPYYNRLFKKVGLLPNDIRNSAELGKVPISTKRDLVEAAELTVSDRFHKKDLVPRSTSGSTGATLHFYQSHKDGLYASVSYDRARSENGFHPFLNRIVMVGAFHDEAQHRLTLGERFDLALKARKRPLFIDMGEGQLAVESTIRDRSFDSIKGYPSFLYLLAHKVARNQLHLPKLKHVFTASEVVDVHVREFINRTLGVDLIDLYGAWEAGCIGWECERYEGYHANIDLVALQVQDEQGNSSESGKGNLIITNLNNFAVPFIRYQTNDIVELTTDLCSCGRPLPLIKSVVGRCDDFVKLTDGRLVSPPGLLVVMHNCGSNVLEFQIEQNRHDELRVRVILIDASRKSKTEAEIRKGLEAFLGDQRMNVVVLSVEGIERTSSGKHKSIISRVK